MTTLKVERNDRENGRSMKEIMEKNGVNVTFSYFEKSNEVDCRFLRSVVKMILDEKKIVGSAALMKSENQTLVDFKQPKELERKISRDDFESLPCDKNRRSSNAILNIAVFQPLYKVTQFRNLLSLKISKEGLSDEELLELCRKTIQYSVKTNHPHFYNQLYAGIDEYSLAGTWLTEALNTSQYSHLRNIACFHAYGTENY
ncbi:glutamate decareboxylase-like protein [Leptotrombidium deliense]|uniref:Glutamate decareboxylase-like protein n=1 Tax=Leptotrombidium deliense TaxID=299467 RepID=A0A443S808_9ACAR|nr:glutamate decareboxylase-like protein [Leptotrombidium deliense]